MFERMRNMNWQEVSVGKLLLLGIVGILVVAIVLALLSSVFRTLSTGMSGGGSVFAPGVATYKGYDAVEELAFDEDSIVLSQRNIMPYESPSVPGNDAEDFEVVEYNGTIKTASLENVCDTISSWKPADDVIFERENRSEHGCWYRFKVERGVADKTLEAVQALRPSELNVETSTIKRQVTDYTSELEILTKKQEVVTETLENATASYDELIELATHVEDVESLAKIIESKVSQLERLTKEQLTINAQLERLARTRDEQVDRLNYVYFTLNVYEYTVFDFDNIKDSWVNEVRVFVSSVSETLQALTLGLLSKLLSLFVLIVYLLILLVVAKYGWRWLRIFWKS